MSEGVHPGFRSAERAVQPTALDVEGSVPEWLSGTLVRNGPGLFDVGDRRVNHWFDGLALLRRYAFDDGGIEYASRFLRSSAYADARAGRLAGQFGTDTRGWRRLLDTLRSLGLPDPTDNANVHVARIDGEYVALTEAPRRVAFDPASLESRGEFAFEDDITEHLAAAHLVEDPHREEWVGFATEFGRRPRYHLYRIPDGARSRDPIASIEADRPAYVHDCSVTREHVLLVETPLVIRALRALDPRSTGAIDMLEWEPDRGTRILVVDRDTGELVAAPDLEPAFCFHHANAYVDADGTVVLDIVEYPDADIVDAMALSALASGGFPDVHDGRLVRYRIDLESETASERSLYDGGMEFPRIFPGRTGRRHRHVFGQATHRDGQNGLVKIDVESGEATEWWAEDVYLEEPVPVRRPGSTASDDGVVLATALDVAVETSSIRVFDAADCSVLARAELPAREPFGFHGRFFPAD